MKQLKTYWLLPLILFASSHVMALSNERYMISPYVWLPELYLELGPFTVERNMNNLIDALNSIFLIKGQVSKGEWGGSIDFNYFSLSSANAGTLFSHTQFNGKDFTIGSAVDLTIKLVFLDLTLSHSLFKNGSNNLSIHSGYRLLNLISSSNLIVSTPNRAITENISFGFYNSNVFLGIDGTVGINRDWEAIYLVDFGAGESKQTEHFEGGLSIKKSWGKVFCTYRYLAWNKAGPFNKFKLNGVAIGMSF